MSHDDYALNCGGVQNLISDEQRDAERLGWNYLHISPARHLLTLVPDVPPQGFGIQVRLNGEAVGRTDMLAFFFVLARLRDEASGVSVVVHHMMAHAPELLRQLCAILRSGHPIVWVHDFFTTCESYPLLRNDAVFCGGPPPDSMACRICHHGDGRRTHLRRVRTFFEATRPILLAPSAVALERWRETTGHPVHSSAAVPLGRLLLAPSSRRRSAGTAEQPLRVAFVGARTFQKGWPAFSDLVDALHGDPRYAFYHLGDADGAPLSGRIRQIPVRVSGKNRQAMIEAVAETGIDVAVVWPFWPETFCFVAHEAVAGGAFVLTNDASGNVARLLGEADADHGLVLESREALLALFGSGELVRRIAFSRPARGALLLGCGTVGWLQGDDGSTHAGRIEIGEKGIGATSHA